jgi:predicted RNase H-like nuclease
MLGGAYTSFEPIPDYWEVNLVGDAYHLAGEDGAISDVQVAGIDSFRGSWVVVLITMIGEQIEWQIFTARNVADATVVTASALCVAIDIPIGLSEGAPLRACDGVPRELLGSCWPGVFAPPICPVIGASDRQQAARLHEGAPLGG